MTSDRVVTGEIAALDAEVRFLDEILDDLEVHALSPNSRRAYTAAWAEFCQFCDKFGFQALPADPQTVRRYIADLAIAQKDDGTPRFTVATIKQKMSGIAWHHSDAGHLDPTSHKSIAHTLKALARKRAEAPSRKRPLLLDDLLALIDAMPHNEYPAGVSAARDTVALWLGWAAALRRSEAAALTIGQVEFHPHDGLWITIGKSKANQDNTKPSLVAIPYGKTPRTCVACALVHWYRLVAAAWDPTIDETGRRRETMRLLFAHETWKPESRIHICKAGMPTRPDGSPLPGLEPDQPVLRATYRNRQNATIAEPTWVPEDEDTGTPGHLRGITGDALGEMILTRLVEAGYRADDYGFHSLRAGLVTQARRNGASRRAVRKISRHGSDAMVDVYDREWNPLEGSAHHDTGI